MAGARQGNGMLCVNLPLLFTLKTRKTMVSAFQSIYWWKIRRQIYNTLEKLLVRIFLLGRSLKLQGRMYIGPCNFKLSTCFRVTKLQVSHIYNYFSGRWAHSSPKHVEKRSKHTKKNCAPIWTYLPVDTGMDGQQNVSYSHTCSLRRESRLKWRC